MPSEAVDVDVGQLVYPSPERLPGRKWTCTSSPQSVGGPRASAITVPQSRNYLGQLISSPSCVAFTPDGRYAYVLDEGNFMASRLGGDTGSVTPRHPSRSQRHRQTAVTPT